MKNSLLWAIFTVVLLVLSVIIGLVVGLLVPGSWAFGVSVLVFVVVMGVTVRNAWTVVPEVYEYIVEVLGKYIGGPWKSGLHLKFPWFGMVVIKRKIQMVTYRLHICHGDDQSGLHQEINGDMVRFIFKDRMIEFTDGNSFAAEYDYLFKVNDSYRCAYATSSAMEFLSIAGSIFHMAVNKYLKNYYYNDFHDIIHNLNSTIILSKVLLDPKKKYTDSELEQLNLEAEERYLKSDVCRTLTSLGIEPVATTLAGVIISDEMLKVRQKEAEALVDLEVADVERKTAMVRVETERLVAEVQKSVKIIGAKANKAAIEIEAKALAKKIEYLSGQNPNLEDVMRLIEAQMQWEAVMAGKVPNLFLGANASMLGAQIGAGIKGNV